MAESKDDANERLIKLGAQHAAFDEHLKENKRLLLEILETLNGNGHPGIKTRLDRLEGSEVRRTRASGFMFAAVWTAIVGLITTKILMLKEGP